MSQLYSRVFVQILDSSIAEDFTLRHVFEDFLKLCDYKTGVVDMTRQALARRLNMPIGLLNESIAKLESPDPASRDPEHQGRRLERLDAHRDWGWRIVNWEKYERIRTRASGAERAARFRESKKETEPFDKPEKPKSFTPPTIEELKLAAAKLGLPSAEAEKFWNHFESNGWKVGGKAPMKSWQSALTTWKIRWEENRGAKPKPRPEANQIQEDDIYSKVPSL